MWILGLKGLMSCSMAHSQVCVAEWLTPRTPDLEVWGSRLAHRIVSLDKELYFTLSLFTQVYKWVPVRYCWGRGWGVTLVVYHL